jgi:hypothetical protein
VITDLPHCLAVTVYHHEVEGVVKVVILEGSVRESRSCPSLNRIASPLPFGAGGTKDAGLLRSNIDAVAACAASSTSATARVHHSDFCKIRRQERVLVL